MSAFPPGYPPVNSGTPPGYAPPPQAAVPQYPGYQHTGFDPAGRPTYAPVQPTYAPPQAAVPPVFPAAAMPVAPSYGVPVAPAGGGDLAFGEIAWSGGLPVGTYVVRLDDIEAGVSGNNNEKLVFTATTLQPANGISAGRVAKWSYTLTEKAIGKLGRDVVNAGVNGQTRYPRDARGMAGALLQELRGTQLLIRSEQQRDGDGVNTSIVSKYNAGTPAATAPVPAAPPPTPTPTPASGVPINAAPPVPPAAAPPGVSFPTAPPSGSGFNAV
jgi:hypothetical protein